jgi:hypothetical protein
MGGKIGAKSRAMLMLLVLATLWNDALGQLVAPCPFNSMCSCKFGAPSFAIHFTTPKSLDNIKDISCVGVPFATLPGKQINILLCFKYFAIQYFIKISTQKQRIDFESSPVT